MRISFDTKQLDKTLRQLPYAVKDAINAVALEVQARERVMMGRNFKIRRSAFIMRRVKMFKWAKVQDLTAVVGIDDQVQGSKLLMAQFEEGGEKTPQGGSILGDRVAIPITGSKARRLFNYKVPTTWKIDRLGLRSILSRAGKGGAIQGDKRTVILPITKGKYKGDFALFSRMGVGWTLYPVYLFISRKVRLRPTLKFVLTARAVVKVRMAALVDQAVEAAIKGVRP